MEFDKKIWDDFKGADFRAVGEMIDDHGAFYLSALKWHHNNQDRGQGICACCEEYSNDDDDDDCSDCPLYVSGDCSNRRGDGKTTYWKWREENDPKYADEMYNALLALMDGGD